MKLSELQDTLAAHPDFQAFRALTARSAQREAAIHLSGLIGSAGAFFASTWYRESRQPLLLIAPDIEKAEYLAADLTHLLDQKAIHLFPSSFRKSLAYGQMDNDRILQRAEVLSALARWEPVQSPPIIVSYPEALAETSMQRHALANNTFELKRGMNLDLEFFIDFLVEHGFERTDFVYEAGSFALRGGIIDVYSFSNEKPFRLELNGDVIESIREFEPNDQLSTREMAFFTLVPNVQTIDRSAQAETLFDYLPKHSHIWIESAGISVPTWEKSMEKHRDVTISWNDTEGNVLQARLGDCFISTEKWHQALAQFPKTEFGVQPAYQAIGASTWHCQPQPSFHKNFQLIGADFKNHVTEGNTVFVFSDSGRQVERLYAIFDDVDPEVQFDPVFHPLFSGFILPALKWACYTEHQLFDRYYLARRRERQSKSRSISLKELRELKPGDFVVHTDHGIGKFAGLEKMDVNSTKVEVVRLVYRDNDLLYVPISALNKLSKYVGKEGTEPRLNKLGSDAWDKLKRNTKAKVKDIARDLIQLYAARKSQAGFAFAPDNYLQTELEASFIYEDTPDQAKATEDFKADMEKPHPMDRLVCGDVGFGKTEIAIRAAFKAVCDSKQVAVLVPTTILAHQHYRTFKERLNGFPVNIDFLNRFRTPKEQKNILKQAAEGRIDILIGTHRLLSKDVTFKNLGLMIIDEEQKFGVAAKEKLRSLRVNIDTLTLTATPIPRTLHFSLMGARDLSIINTPPPNRQPVTTELHAYDPELIKEAILAEVNRGGQAFIIHNRVKDIYELAEKIRELCPGVKVGVGHGQLEGHELEEVMIRFVEGDYDVLVATTIIESGLDISNANTIIINNAHMYGLSDIHQMRGRVGRSNKKAYCYLLVPALGMLTEDARKRLAAIEEFSDLGSGFNVAMRDLDIRGSGNLLGAEQSGFIAEIGYDLYHKILDEAVRELKDEEFGELFADEAPMPVKKDVMIETDLELVIPDHYVRSNQERLALYGQLAGIETEEQLQDYGRKLRDRFGPLPPQVLDLMEAVKLKWAAQPLFLDKVVLRGRELTLYFPADQQSPYYEGPIFGHIIHKIGQSPSKYQMKQTPKSLQLKIGNIMGIPAAAEALHELGS